jgi:hypothetical protein
MKYARLALKVVRQNYGDFVEVILLYKYKHVLNYTEQLSATITLIILIFFNFNILYIANINLDPVQKFRQSYK